tara:strand:+ start:53 stop:970 length:918 start_codon:yes stop_codon:yes gene_type:complete
MALVGTPVAVGTASTTLIVCPATLETSLHSLLVNNPTSGNLNLTLSYFDSSASAESTLLTQAVSANTSLKAFSAPVNLASGDKINASASGTGLIALVSSFQNASTPAAVGFTPRGEYSSGTTYAINDVVSNDGSSFISQFAGNLNRGTSNSSAWLTLAAKGDQGDITAAGTAELTNKSFADSVTVSASLTANTVNDVDGDLRTIGISTATDTFTFSAENTGNTILMSSANLVGKIPSAAASQGILGGQAISVVSLTNSAIISSQITMNIAGASASTARCVLSDHGMATIYFLSNSACIVNGNVGT